MELNSTTFPNDSIKYLAPSWKDMDRLVFAISKKILQDRLKIDRVVTMAKGGWPMARPLVDYVGVREVASIGLKLYKGINEKHIEPEVYQDINADVSNETILLFADVADTGETLEFCKTYLEQRGAKKIYTATLFFKPHSSILPDYLGRETVSWIIFPYELRETMEVLVKKWEREGVEKEVVLGRFVELGFDQEMVEYFYSIKR